MKLNEHQEQFLSLAKGKTEELLHPGFVDGLGFIILNDSVELFEEFCLAHEGEALFESERDRQV